MSRYNTAVRAGLEPDHLSPGRHERFQYGNLSVDELAQWCVAATYAKVLRERNPFRRRPKHIKIEHLPYVR